MSRVQLESLLKSTLSDRGPDFDFFHSEWERLKTKDSVPQEIEKSTMEFVFRSGLKEYLNDTNAQKDISRCENLVELALQASRSGLCTPTLPILLLSDLFDMVSLEECEKLFDCLDRNVSKWKEDTFFVPVKNHLLRLCNDLLRRLSRSQNTIFCGRILLFLAKFFPFSERSALNVISEFNLENTTVFNKPEEVEEKEKLSLDQEDGTNLNLDYAMYKKFWLLQDFFRHPIQCYDRVKWKEFSTCAKDVLNTFNSFKLDSIAVKKEKEESIETASKKLKTGPSSSDQYFAKYLTNRNLLQLQLSDSNFRRYILIQFLILFQYLQSSVKFKSENDVLSNEQNRWLENAKDKVYKLLSETYPLGKEFCSSVKHIMQREQQWNVWKNEGCNPAAFQLPKTTKAEEENGDKKIEVSPKKPVVIESVRKRKRKLGDQIKEASMNSTVLMGNTQLTKLWNVCLDNMEACSAPERDFLPSMEDYFEEAIEQLNPDNQIEEEYKRVNDGAWGWRALRLLAKKSPHFFTYGNNPIAKLPDYLDQMLRKMTNKELSTSTSSDKDSKGEKASKTDETPSSNVCTIEALEKLAEQLQDKWKKLIPKLGLTNSDIKSFESQADNEKDQAMLMLKEWLKVEGDGATADEMVYILEGLKMKSIANAVFSNSNASVANDK